MKSRLARFGTGIGAVLAVAALTGAPAASATGGSTAHCSIVGASVVCLGTLGINGNSVEIDVLNVDANHLVTVQNVLNNDEVNILNGITVQDTQTQVNQIASDNAVDVSRVVNVCQVKVIEVGKVNNNLAQCK
jgi:hypothetical protein